MIQILALINTIAMLYKVHHIYVFQCNNHASMLIFGQKRIRNDHYDKFQAINIIWMFTSPFHKNQFYKLNRHVQIHTKASTGTTNFTVSDHN